MEFRNVFGQNIQRLRVQRKLTQEQLCEQAEIDRSYLQRIEKGASSPTVEVAARIRSSLQCSWDEMFAGLD